MHFINYKCGNSPNKIQINYQLQLRILIFFGHIKTTQSPVKVPALNFAINLPVKYFIVLISSDDNVIILWLLPVN